MKQTYILVSIGLTLAFSYGCNKAPTAHTPEWKYFDPSNQLISFSDATELPATEVAQTYQSSCKQEHALSCNRLASLYVAGIGVERNPKEAKRLYERACTLGEKRGCYSIKVGIDHQDPRYLPLMGQWCDAKELGACEYLAAALEYGDRAQHIAMNRRLAVQFYRKACKLGSRKSCARIFDLTQVLDKAD